MVRRERAPAVLHIDGQLERHDVPRLCAAARALTVHARDAILVCDVRRATPDAVTVDALAHLTLTLRSLGRDLRVRGAPTALVELLELAALRDVLSIEDA